ncbi:Hpt domain-containing protein [Sphingomonas sp. Mn802worker]|uniref:Hpt domain-containing protein n=1 Tax=Sphingomonas sp. Mn802worker TaxID=629773 RepID=UPI0003645773|nr:Hpt domain-containing protein [Sphingomonas sp. Mn802worker]
MGFEGEGLVDRAVLARARAELGSDLPRILGYFREDGLKSVDAIEAASRDENATALILPAHTLKGEARQFGATPLAAMAEKLENLARECVELHTSPVECVPDVLDLRPLFEATLAFLEREVAAMPQRRVGGFGRRIA